MKRLIAASVIVLAAAASAASAQPVYKSTMPDGKVVYGEKPAPGAKRVDEIKPPPPKTGMTTVTPAEKARVEQQAKARAAGGPTVQAQLEDARKQLQQAESSREAAKEPLPGERIGTAGGGSRLTDAYHERQKSLDLALEAARKRVNDLQSGR